MIKGEDRLKQQGQLYLPRPEGMSAQAYADYVKGASFYAVAERTLRGMVITTIPDDERLAIVAQHFHDAKVRSALTNAAIVDEFGEDTDRDLKWVLRELKALLESASGDDDKVLKLGTLKELRQSLMALAELHGRLNKKMDIHLNLSESPQFVKLRSIILDVLGRHPDAKEDFLEQMRVLQVIDARVPA